MKTVNDNHSAETVVEEKKSESKESVVVLNYFGARSVKFEKLLGTAQVDLASVKKEVILTE